VFEFPDNLSLSEWQAAIPVSMAVTKCMIRSTEYKTYHYVGALLVVGGLVVSLIPQFQHSGAGDDGGSNQLLWVAILIASCVPMAGGYAFQFAEFASVEVLNLVR
jgi:hypothetical protein